MPRVVAIVMMDVPEPPYTDNMTLVAGDNPTLEEWVARYLYHDTEYAVPDVDILDTKVIREEALPIIVNEVVGLSVKFGSLVSEGRG